LVIPYHYSLALDFVEELAPVREKGQWGFIDPLGQTIIPFRYDHAHSFQDGLALVEKDGKWAYLDTEGTVVWREA
jgi:hypothetical protein